MNEKTRVYLAFIITLSVCIPLAIWMPHPPPQDKTVNIHVVCQETQEPVPDGLTVTLTNGGTVTQRISGGAATFTDIPLGNYTVKYYWNQWYCHNITLTCDQCCWNFTYQVPNPIIIKHFKSCCGGLPKSGSAISGLNVTLLENGIPITWQLSNASGTVVFDGTHVAVCNEYTLQYTWQGISYTEPEPPIHFVYNKCGKLLVCTWEETNCLPVSKCGGDSG